MIIPQAVTQYRALLRRSPFWLQRDEERVAVALHPTIGVSCSFNAPECSGVQQSS
jgi:hypothetical protein